MFKRNLRVVLRAASAASMIAALLAGCGSDGKEDALGSTGSPDEVPTAGAGAPAEAAHHARCGWIEAGNTDGYADFAAHAASFDVVHPDWFRIASDGIQVQAYDGADDSRVLDAARANHVLVWPLVAGVDDATYAEGMYRDSSRRSQHIQVLVDLAVSRGYDGLDIDYEHLPTSDRAAFTTFMTELAAAMHAKGKRVSAAVYGESSDASVYDYAALSAVTDVVHIMGYDFHWLGGPHVGPVSPLGWIQAIAQYAAGTGRPGRFVMGLPNYGLGDGVGCHLGDCPGQCAGSIATTTSEMSSCSLNPDGFAPGRSPNCAAGNGRLYFDDVASLEEKVAAAKAAGLAGVTWWGLGREPDGLFDMVAKYYGPGR
jgi:spore germination protein YaaH